jgi:hypothetical protein
MGPETILAVATSKGMTSFQAISMPKVVDPVQPLDYKIVRSICDAVGERLQQNLRPDFSRTTPYLQQLIDELRKRDRDAGPKGR